MIRALFEFMRDSWPVVGVAAVAASLLLTVLAVLSSRVDRAVLRQGFRRAGIASTIVGVVGILGSVPVAGMMFCGTVCASGEWILLMALVAGSLIGLGYLLLALGLLRGGVLLGFGRRWAGTVPLLGPLATLALLAALYAVGSQPVRGTRAAEVHADLVILGARPAPATVTLAVRCTARDDGSLRVSGSSRGTEVSFGVRSRN